MLLVCIPAVPSLGSFFDRLVPYQCRRDASLVGWFSDVETGGYDVNLVAPFTLTFHFLKGYWSDEQIMFFQCT